MSLVGKYRYSERHYAEGYKYAHFSKKKYRPHHKAINKKMDRFDNDGIDACIEKDDGSYVDINTGINKSRWNFSDHDYNDERKDGNKCIW